MTRLIGEQEFSDLIADRYRYRVERDSYRQIGDLMQSEASRLAEFVRQRAATGLALPYEVHQALLGVEGAVRDWTEARTGPSNQKEVGGDD